MKIHRYQVKVCESIMDLTHDFGWIQTRLFIPRQGVLGYRRKEQIKIDFSPTTQNLLQKPNKL